MSKNKRFLRQCCCCKEIKAKTDLIRITKDSGNNEVKINEGNKYIGRSVYICKNKECIEQTIRKRTIQRQLKCEIGENIKEELYTVLTK